MMVGIEPDKVCDFSCQQFEESYLSALFIRSSTNMEIWVGYKVYTS